MEVFYKVKVIKVTKGIRETTSWEKLLDDKNPKLLANPEEPQYGSVKVVKAFTDEESIFEQRLSEVDLQRVIRACNKDVF